jgi:hypothetical protein
MHPCRLTQSAVLLPLLFHHSVPNPSTPSPGNRFDSVAYFLLSQTRGAVEFLDLCTAI